MTQLEINRIKKVFHDNYSDLGIYRWLNRMKNWIKPFFALTFIAVLSMALIWSPWPITYWAFAFIGTLFLGAIDHLYISLTLKNILNILESENIEISLETLLDICSDILPK